MSAAISEADLDATFAALADGTRRAIVARLATGEASVMDLASPFDMSQPAVSKHLRVLERAGLISRRRDAQRRPCRLEPRRLQQIAEWVVSYRAYWEESYDRLDDYLQELQAQASRPEGGARQSARPSARHPQQRPSKEKSRDLKKTRSHRRPR